MYSNETRYNPKDNFNEIYAPQSCDLCVYFSPNIRARSLSTHMAVNVNRDTEHYTKVGVKAAS